MYPPQSKSQVHMSVSLSSRLTAVLLSTLILNWSKYLFALSLRNTMYFCGHGLYFGDEHETRESTAFWCILCEDCSTVVLFCCVVSDSACGRCFRALPYVPVSMAPLMLHGTTGKSMDGLMPLRRPYHEQHTRWSPGQLALSLVDLYFVSRHGV